MYKEDEEEYKKRMQEAQNIISNINNYSDNSNNSTFISNNYSSINLSTKQNSYINKIKEADNIINSINPTNNISDQELLQKEVDKLNKFYNNKTNEQRISQKMDELWTDDNTSNANNTNKQQVQPSPERKNQTKSKEEIDQQIKSAEMQTVNPSANKTNSLVDTDIKIGLASSEETKNTQELSTLDIKAMKEANQKNENIEKGGIDAFNEWADTVLNNILGGTKQAAAGLANVITTVTGLGIRGLEGASGIVGLKDMANSLNQVYNNVIDTGSNINEKANYEKTVNSQVKDDFVKTSGDVSNVISNMIGNTVIGYATGISGTVVQGLSVGGGSSQEVLDENKDNIGQATVTGIAKGYISYLTERMFDANILTRGSKKTSIQEGINRIIANKINSKLGKEVANRTVGIIGENLEELAEDNAGYLIDKLINNKDLPSFEQWWNNTTETAKTTTLSTMIMGLLGLGGESFSDIEMNMETEYWIEQAQQIIEQEDLAIHFNPNEVKNLNETEQFYITRFTQEGELANIVPTRGKTIYNPRQELNITPVVVKDSETNFYNIIDGNTGVVLDNTYYATTMEAEGSFNEKANKLTDLQVKDINNKINEANYLITDKIMNTINEAKEQLIQNNISENTSNINISQNTNTDIAQTSSQGNTAHLQSKETSYTSQDVQKVVEPFSSQEEYTKNEMAKIWNEEINANNYDVVYDSDGNIQSYVAIEEDGNKIYANLYDSNDNLVKSEVIPIENGKYTAEAIKNTIEKVTDVYDENRPDNRQIDIESNNAENKKRSISPLNDVETTPNSTSKTSRLSASNISSIPQNNDIIKSIKTFEKAKNYTNRQDVVNLATALKVYHKGATFIDTNILNKSGNNKKPKIIEITNYFKEYTDNEDLRKLALKYARENYQGTTILNKDTQTNIDISRTGITKTFGTNRDNIKMQTANILDNIIEESIYINSSLKKNDPNIVYHHYFTPVKYNNNNMLSMITIKEIITDKNENHKFYYHDIRKIDNIQKELSQYLPQQKLSNKFGEKTPTVNNSISQKTETVKSDTAINNKSTQKTKNNTIEQENIQKELHNRIQNAILSKNSKKNTYLGEVSIKVVNRVKSLLGIDISNRRHVIPDYNIRHIINQHGNETIEKSKGQIAVTTKDIEKIPDIINNYDRIEKGNTNTNSITQEHSESIRYIKKYNDNISYVVEVVPKTGNTLEIKTMWKKPVRVTNSKNTPSLTSKTKSDLSSSTLKQNPIGLSHGNNKTLPYTSETKSNSGSKNSITQNMENVKDDNIRSMKQSNSNITNNQKTTDNQGRELSKGQQKYFKDSKVRDENNNLITMYHGTDFDFNVFKNKKAQHGRAITDGYYFTTDIENAESYGKNLKEVYLDIKNPFYLHDNNGVTSELRARGYDIDSLIKGNQLEADSSGVVPTAKSLKKFLQKNGYDGIITLTSDNEKIDINNPNNQIVIFKSNQAKEVTNTNPTTNEDIRFAKRTAKSQNKNIDQTQRNAEREGSYIEQEIQKIEKTGNWDNSIPATKLTDIRKTIEDYLGLGIKKGHFREQAYAIYKGNRDVIRTKEYKDMDSILHEVGHALDIGNRLNIDKGTISSELLTAIDKLGGYEQETRPIRLEEGFAEVIREYTIIPEQAKTEYPQTISVIEQIRQNDKSFNNFITKVQEQTYNYIHQNPRNRTLSNQSVGEQTDKTPLTKNWLKQEIMRNIYDKDYAVKSAVNELAKVGGKTSNNIKASENAYLLTRLANGIGEKVSSMLADGYIDENGIKLMPGLNKIGEILENNPDRFNDLRAYLVAQRDVEYKAKSLKTGIRSMDSKAVIQQFKNDSQIQEAARLVYDTLDGVMQYAVNNGLITQKTVDDLKESNAFYVPMQRVLENRGSQVGRRGAVSDVIKKRTGSELDIKDVLENIVTNSSNIIQQVENNNILKAFFKQGQESGLTGAVYDVISTPFIKIGTEQLSTWETELKKQGVDTTNLDLEKTIDLFAPNNKVDSKNLITSFINDEGQRVYLQFNDEILFNSLMNMDKKFMSQVLKINSKMNMPLRYGATMANIGFAIPNMISDTAQAAIYSTAGFIPVVDNALGVLDILSATNNTVKKFVDKVAPEYAQRINTLYTIYEQTGATSSTRLSQYRETSQSVMKDVYGTKKSENLGIKESFKPLKRLLDLMTYIPEISEQSTRFEVFKKNYDYYKNKGNSEMDVRIMAAIESRDATQDFGRTGNITREINQLIPFSAARVGSIYTFAEKVKANPKQVGMRIAVLTALAMAIKAIGYDDDEIEELNQRKKDDNFVFKIGDNVVTIKKPQGILRSMINLTEYIQDLATGHIEEGKESERLGNWINNAIMDNMPADSITGLVPNTVAPLIENAINKDFYYNTDIVNSYDLELPDKDQYYEYNSQLAIWLGSIFNYSPAKIDNLISGYFGGLGTQVTNIMDSMLGKAEGIAEKPDMGAESNAVGKRFIVNVNSNSTSIDEIYTRKDELTKKKNGGTITDEEAKELTTITEAVSNMSKLNKQIKEIKKDLSLSGKEKAEDIKLLQQQRTDTARQALGKDLIYNSNASKIQSTQFYPTNQTLKQNGYTLTLNSGMKKEYEKLANGYYSKYEKQGIYSEKKLKDLKSKAKDYAKNQLMQKYKTSLVKTIKQ